MTRPAQTSLDLSPAACAPRGSVSDADAERKRAECRKRVVAAAEAFYARQRLKAGR